MFSPVETIDFAERSIVCVNEFIYNSTEFPKLSHGPLSSPSIQILPGLVWASNRTHDPQQWRRRRAAAPSLVADVPSDYTDCVMNNYLNDCVTKKCVS